MDYLTDVLTMFLCVDHGNILAEGLLVPKMNEGLTGLERHEGE